MSPDPVMSPSRPCLLVESLRPLVAAEADAEAQDGALESADLEQDVWVRLLERLDAGGPPRDAGAWVRGAVRDAARTARLRALRERSFGDEQVPEPLGREDCPERAVLAAERHRAIHAAVARTPGPCPRLLTALLSPSDPTYREIAGQLGISQGSLGPMRSRCLGCLRRMLAAEVAAPGLRGKER
ncbi:sigma-70 family RNA polymerase sigma factor [Streptomyces sp. SCSIO 30461]|uniref:sigma-70 family RNA polymerase sigma factor n=1 Tax=Streptomyces sp. SCSIO 30461 TaxID=3118085 RepID=UPI0030CD7FB9